MTDLSYASYRNRDTGERVAAAPYPDERGEPHYKCVDSHGHVWYMEGQQFELFYEPYQGNGHGWVGGHDGRSV